MTVRNFLIDHGFLEAHTMCNSSGEYTIFCPECGHKNRKCYVNGEGRGLNCKHCGFASSWRAFTRRYDPPTPVEQALENFTHKAEEFLWTNVKMLDYLKERGLSEQTIRAMRLGYWPDGDLGWEIGSEAAIEIGLKKPTNEWTLRDRIIIPYTRDGIVETVRGRANPFGDDKIKYMSLPGTEVTLFYPQALDVASPIFIAEGEFDAIVLYQVGYQALASPGANVGIAKQLLSFPRCYICFDGDDAGRSGAKAIKNQVPEVYEVSLPDGMDVSDYIKTYGEDSFTHLVANAKFYVNGKEQTDDRLDISITQWEDWAWSNGELLGPKICWAPRLEKALSGWSRGLFLVGALPNSGKSCFFVKSAYEAAKDNPDDTVCVYLSLDDDQEDAISRLVSLHTGVSFEIIRMPRFSFDHPTDLTRRDPQKLDAFMKSLASLKEVNNLVFRDAKFGRSLQYIRHYLSSLRRRYPDKYIVVFIDSLAKVTAEDEPMSTPINNWKAFLATELKYQSTLHDLCIVTPADFRKLNDERRPNNDDLKDASELAYEANAVLLGFNELNVKGDPNRVILKWSEQDQGGLWYPIFELNTTKNKKSLYRGNIRFKFFPPTSQFLELDERTDREFDQQIRDAQANGRRGAYTTPTGTMLQADFTPADIFQTGYQPSMLAR